MKLIEKEEDSLRAEAWSRENPLPKESFLIVKDHGNVVITKQIPASKTSP